MQETPYRNYLRWIKKGVVQRALHCTKLLSKKQVKKYSNHKQFNISPMLVDKILKHTLFYRV